MAVPAVCWVVFAILWMTGVELRIFFIMCIVIAPVFLIDSLDADENPCRTICGRWSISFRPNTFQVYQKVSFSGHRAEHPDKLENQPHASIRIVTIAELVGALTGIGHGLVLAQEMFSVAAVFAWTVVLVIILFAFQLILTIVEHRVLAWRGCA